MVTGMRGDRARSTLTDTRFADVQWVEETGSTNHDLLELAAAGARGGQVLVADHQTAGRGRLDRSWHAPGGGSLLLSVLLRPELPASDAHLLSTAVGISAVEACAELAGVPARLKWPNDLVIDRPDGGSYRKLGGILAESIIEHGAVTAVVVGLGLNVNWPAELPDELREIATALNGLAGHEVDREELLIALLMRLDHWYERVVDPLGTGRDELMGRARQLSSTLGRRVGVDLGAEQIVGTAVELTDDGELVVDVDLDGVLGGAERRTIVAGDVVHLRPAG
jgi:BirA family biotin operon repressor/biotin-[acetyl-CoA-carboxylase] ligase